MSLEHTSPAPAAAVSKNMLSSIDDVLRRLGRTRAGQPQRIESARNDNFQVPTNDGPLLVRLHRPSRARERLELNLAAMAHAGAHGIPVTRPLADSEGNVLLPGGGRLASVYPWVEAASYDRGAISAAQAATLGDLHGRLHVALADFAHPALPPYGEMAWNRDESIAVLSRVDDLIRYYPAPGEDQLLIQQGLRFQLSLLESGFPRPDSDFDALSRQALHGDIHEGNVLIAVDGTVAAVVDWDMAGSGPRLVEVVRALDFTLALDDDQALEAYVSAYGAADPYPAAEVEPSVDAWIQCVIHNTWVYRSRFIEGDRRVDQFLAAKPKRDREFADPAFRQRLLDVLLRFAS